MKIPRLGLATKNPGKVEEMTAIVRRMGFAAEIVEGLDWPDVDETGDTLEANAVLKATAVVEATGLPALADDTGLMVKALDGRPGVWSARYAGGDATFADNRRKLLAELEGVDDRTAHFATGVALMFPDGSLITAEGRLEGLIARSERGTGGFGYDALFEVDGVTLAEMSDEEKNRLSHRARAIEALGEKLGL